jgi:hypothetical protein
MFRCAKWIGSMLLAGAALAGPVSDGLACGNEVEIKIDPTTRAVQTAEHALEQGKWQLALRTIAPVMKAPPTGSRQGLARRASVLAVLAVARSEGRYALDGSEIADGERRSAEIARVVAMSDKLHASDKDDAAGKTNHAEVLSHAPDRRDEAFRTLSELESADLLSSAYAYAALAKLRSSPPRRAPGWVAPAWLAMQHAKAKVAHARCERMATKKEICAG